MQYLFYHDSEKNISIFIKNYKNRLKEKNIFYYGSKKIKTI